MIARATASAEVRAFEFAADVADVGAGGVGADAEQPWRSPRCPSRGPVRRRRGARAARAATPPGSAPPGGCGTGSRCRRRRSRGSRRPGAPAGTRGRRRRGRRAPPTASSPSGSSTISRTRAPWRRERAPASSRSGAKPASTIDVGARGQVVAAFLFGQHDLDHLRPQQGGEAGPGDRPFGVDGGDREADRQRRARARRRPGRRRGRTPSAAPAARSRERRSSSSEAHVAGRAAFARRIGPLGHFVGGVALDRVDRAVGVDRFDQADVLAAPDDQVAGFGGAARRGDSAAARIRPSSRGRRRTGSLRRCRPAGCPPGRRTRRRSRRTRGRRRRPGRRSGIRRSAAIRWSRAASPPGRPGCGRLRSRRGRGRTRWSSRGGRGGGAAAERRLAEQLREGLGGGGGGET